MAGNGRTVIILLTTCIFGPRVEAQLRWTPQLLSQVPDTTRVRFSVNGVRWSAAGRALGWQSSDPRIVGAAGDTVRLPADAEIWVFTDRRNNFGVFGGISGLLAGVSFSLANCAPNFRYCGEQDPSPAIGALVGYFIGRAIKRDRWVRVNP